MMRIHPRTEHNRSNGLDRQTKPKKSMNMLDMSVKTSASTSGLNMVAEPVVVTIEDCKSSREGKDPL
jgi:hypothetical protein